MIKVKGCGSSLHADQTNLGMMFAVLVCFLLCAHPAYAICGMSEGKGAIFYNFDRLIIYYSSFTPEGEQKVPGYPEDLKYDNFTRQLTDAVKKNFSSCLTDESGKAKEIVVTDKHIQQIFDPKSLTVVISVDYVMSPPHPPRVIDFGMLTYDLYRPGLPPQDAIVHYTDSSYARPVFPKRGDEFLRKEIDEFLWHVRPVDYRPASDDPNPSIESLPSYVRDEVYYRLKHPNIIHPEKK